LQTDLFDIIRPELALVEQKLREGLDALFPPLAEAALTLLNSGGKRLRPALAVLAARFGPGAATANVTALAAAVETLHTATLVHDDLIDGARVRRGRATLSASWATAPVVLAGDYLFARAAGFAADTNSVEVVKLFSEALRTICDGELRQLFGAFDLEQAQDTYYVRIFSKTASLFAVSARAGAALSGADAATVEALYQYGRNLGMSFQIEDDMLDFVGDEQLLGKPVGSDLRQGIVTLPVYYFLRENPQRDAWRAGLAASNPERGAVVDRLVAEIRQAPAIAACWAEAQTFARQAQEALAALPDIEEKRRLLTLAETLLRRQH
jgi:geranylgeranyl pyrophosphate synthase